MTTADRNPDNRWIYENCYNHANYELNSGNRYDQHMYRLRFSLVEKYAQGGEVLDLCCGTGSYLLPLAEKVKRIAGLDFSSRVLEELRSKLSPEQVNKIELVEADAREIPFEDSTFDCVYSYSSLYTIPDLNRVLGEVNRVLREGGAAILDMGNSTSLNRLISFSQYKRNRWARPYMYPLATLRAMVQSAGFEILEHRCFQLLPMYGCPKSLLPLWPLCHPAWKRVMGIPLPGGRILDELISGAPVLRPLAFRHIIVGKKLG